MVIVRHNEHRTMIQKLQHLKIAYEITADEPLNPGSGINIAEGRDTVFQSHPVWKNRLIFTLSWRIK